MVITVFGATGQVGRRIVSTALSLDKYVRAFGRNVEGLIDEDLHNDKFEVVKGYVFDDSEVYNAVKGADAVLSALGGDISGSDKTRSLGIKNIVRQMERTNVKRIVVVGGFGVLKNDEYEYILNKPDYAPEFQAVGKEHLKAYEYLKTSNLNWTFVCCPDIIDADATGKYITSEDYPPTPNLFTISTGNLALFMVNEVLSNRYIKKRVGISNTK